MHTRAFCMPQNVPSRVAISASPGHHGDRAGRARRR